ncbi:hypothetical protein [Massilia violaceinigra]|uniref:hypothetical protein n=1 Tax=Massilia violaceinigra TaxID=2045208 RepID=UPI0012FE363F|nr:hypothetical protein [Massilia violaceinigra]
MSQKSLAKPDQSPPQDAQSWRRGSSAARSIALPRPRAEAVKWRPHDAAEKTPRLHRIESNDDPPPSEINAAAVKNGPTEKHTPMMAQYLRELVFSRIQVDFLSARLYGG